MPLKQPSAALDKRIEAAFWHARWNNRLRWSSLAGVAVAAVVAGALTVNLFHQTETPAITPGSVAGSPTPVVSPSNMVDYRETVPAGVYRGQDGTNMRAYKRIGVKEVWSLDPATGAKVKTVVPQEETILVPANFD